MANPNLYEDNKGKVTKESASGGGKFYTFAEDDYDTVKGAGKDIETIMLNGGFTTASYDESEQFTYYIRFVFGGNTRDPLENKAKYQFSDPLGLTDVTTFEIIGDDLHVTTL